MRNSVHYRKYHIQNVMFNKCSKGNMQITTIDKNKIFEIFKKTESVLPSKTSEFYEKYWNRTKILIGDDIKTINN